MKVSFSLSIRKNRTIVVKRNRIQENLAAFWDQDLLPRWWFAVSMPYTRDERVLHGVLWNNNNGRVETECFLENSKDVVLHMVSLLKSLQCVIY
jgi:hypothetical protein